MTEVEAITQAKNEGQKTASFRRFFPRYKYVATPKTRDIRASLWLVGHFASPLRRPVDDRFKIGAATNAAFASFFAFQRCKTSWKIAFENSGIVADALSLATPRLSTDRRICGLYQWFS
jgi:hypothetical protein